VATSASREDLLREIEELRARLQEAEDVLKAIRRGEVDAIVVNQDQGDRVALILAPALDENSIGFSSSTSRCLARGVTMEGMERVLSDSSEMQPHSLYLGKSEAAIRLSKLVQAASEKQSTLLLEGETGTGKSMIARWIYERSDRAVKAFVEINCASLKGDLLANELFGHVRGAFTSATDTKEGLLDVANGGTLFLDEIGDMDPGVQSQFLKVLEEKRYRRLGDVQERRSEFRLICATNRNLAEEIQKNTFRKDLFYRINIFPIEIPPLRKRPEDIPGFADSILHTLRASQTRIDPTAMRLLQEYHWPGNIRELRNVIERALLLSHGSTLTSEDFPGIASFNNFGNDAKPDEIQAAIDRFKGNKKRAAEYLGISRVTLYRKLRRS
jgi:transcriptional regulator with PAS, ATPase and Fis domain